MSVDRFASRFGTDKNSTEAGTSSSKGDLVRRLELLIVEGQKKIRAFEEGRTIHIGYIREFRNFVQHCLLDIGEAAKDELARIVLLDLGVSEGLQRYYDKHIFNASDVQDGNPSEFLQLQNEYDQAMPPKLQEIVRLLNQVRDKMLGQPKSVHPIKNIPKRRFGPRPAMERHQRIAEVVRQHGDKWKQEEELDRIATELDQEKISVSPAWAKWNPPARSWKRAVEYNREKTIKAINYSLAMASREQVVAVHPHFQKTLGNSR